MRFLVGVSKVLKRSAFDTALGELDPSADIVAVDPPDDISGTRLAANGIHLVLLEASPAAPGWVSQLKRLKAGRPTVPCVVFVPRPDADIVTVAIRAGASGVMMADDNRELIVNALRLVLAGGVYLSPALVDALVGEEKPWGPLPGEQITANAVHDLTSRQRQVLDLVGSGLANKEIAGTLGIKTATVKLHVNAIFRALHVHNRTQAALLVHQSRP